MSPWRRRLRRIRLGVQALFAFVVIGAAFVVGVTQLVVLPWLAAHPDSIGRFLADRLHRPVHIDEVDARWERNGPLLSLRGVHIGEQESGQPALLVARAGLKVNLFAWAQRNGSWNEFRIDGLDLDLEHEASGRWQLRGLAAGDSSDSADQKALLELGALDLRNVTLTVTEASDGRQYRFAADELRLINSGQRHHLAARLRYLQTRSEPVDTVIEYNSAEDAGTAYIGGSALDLAAILRGYPPFGISVLGGTGRVQLWGHWHAGKVTDAQLEVGVKDLLIEAHAPVDLDPKRHVAPRASFENLAFGARWVRSRTGWIADVADLRIERQGIVLAPAAARIEKTRTPAGDAHYDVDLREVDLAGPAALAMMTDRMPAAWRRWLYLANPEGAIHDARLRWAGAEDFDLAGDVRGLGWRAVDALPGARGVNGRVLGDQAALTLELPRDNPLSIEEPHVFRRPFRFTDLSGTIAAYRTDAAWRVESDAVSFEGDGYGGELRGALEFPDAGGRPFIDAYAVTTHAMVPAAHLFWPINVMPPPAVAWLDNALAAGRVGGGRAAIRGDLADWPFRDFSGRFEARARVDDVKLRYLPDWPAAEHVRATAEFVNTSLHAEADAGTVGGNKFSRATADIADLGEPVLELDVTAQGKGHDLLGLLKSTPIGLRFGVQLLGVDVGGQCKVDFHLHVPIKETERLVLAGTAALSDAELTDAKYALRLTHANGKVRFSQAGFSADDLAVTMHDQPATFALSVGAFTADTRHVVEASLGANLPAAKVLAYAPALSAYADNIGGSAKWNAVFSADAGEEGGQHLVVTSDLRGVSSNLPAPLDKAADAALPLRLNLGMPLDGGSIDVTLGKLLQLHGHLASATSPFAARVNFGGEGPADVPASGFVIDGRTGTLDLSGWMDFAAGNSGDGALLQSVDLQADSLTAYTRDFGAAHFTLTRAGDALDLGFKGTNVEGTMHMPLVGLRKHGVTAQFARLYWPEASDVEPSTLSGENPANVPPLHVHVADFHLGKETFGETSVETYPIADGAHFEQVSAHSTNVEMRARGDWTGRPGSDRSTFTIELSAHDTGRMLDAFGYSGVIIGGQTVAHIEGSWAGAPSAFAMVRLDGTLKVSMKDGRIPDADPGASRVLGLFNLAAIPRRLAFDFGDLFKSGFSFDSIDGKFTLKDGSARTDDLVVRSPTADMRLKGSMDLKARDWDQTVEVTPHVGGTLAVGGALIGGPVGAAAGALIQGVFKKQINSVARAEYKVTGSWENPTVKVLAKETIRPKKTAPKNDGQPAQGKQAPAEEPKRG